MNVTQWHSTGRCGRCVRKGADHLVDVMVPELATQLVVRLEEDEVVGAQQARVGPARLMCSAILAPRSLVTLSA